MNGIVLGRHAFGRFDRRLPIGPIQWPHHDLLWLHEGQAHVTIADRGPPIRLRAPNGILILPDTPFRGGAIGAYATASVCHFALCAATGHVPAAGPGILYPAPAELFALHSQIRLALQLARTRPQDMARRERLLLAILDGFVPTDARTTARQEPDRLTAAWDAAALQLETIRGLADVAALMGIGESALRAIHRRTRREPAGAYLRELRLVQAENLLATTGLSVEEIAAKVGYGHAESFHASFRRSRGITPGEWRRRAKPFA